jgi:hypothetical protein
MVANLTPLSFAFQPALQVDVDCAGNGFDPGALTRLVFDTMVHL